MNLLDTIMKGRFSEDWGGDDFEAQALGQLKIMVTNCKIA